VTASGAAAIVGSASSTLAPHALQNLAPGANWAEQERHVSSSTFSADTVAPQYLQNFTLSLFSVPQFLQ
jgi:hypothetical protein